MRTCSLACSLPCDCGWLRPATQKCDRHHLYTALPSRTCSLACGLPCDCGGCALLRCCCCCFSICCLMADSALVAISITLVNSLLGAVCRV